jgi:peptidoglycan/LPS O-acetylase OafA/YrhL
VTPQREVDGRPKIAFANQLRGVAALFVVLSHFGGVFVVMAPTVSWIISAPQVNTGHPLILHITLLKWLNFGPLGVAIFFLISGFVIPLSFGKLASGPFLLARAFRIFPTFWAALTIEWITVLLQSQIYGRPMAFGPLTYFSNASLLDTIFNNGYVDLVNWTLAIELKFYLVMALMRPWILRGRITPLIGCSLLAIAIAAARARGEISANMYLTDEPMFIGYMMIGTLFFYRMEGLISRPRLLVASAILIALFAICWKIGPAAAQFPIVTVNYVYAIGVFAACYFLRQYFRPVKLIDIVADISFPLYLVHSIIGYSLMTVMIRAFKLPYAAALPIALSCVLGLAWLLHKLIERPSQLAGKRLARNPYWRRWTIKRALDGT